MAVTQGDIDALLQQLADAIASGNTGLANQLAAQIRELLSQGVEDEDAGTIIGGYNTQDAILNPQQPHGTQAIQRSFWNFPGVRCGRCRSCPKYWKITFDWTRPNGPDAKFEDYFGPIPQHSGEGEIGWGNGGDENAVFFDLKYLFCDSMSPESGPLVYIQRGPMARRPIGGESGSLQEAIQKRYFVEYDRCFWKKGLTVARPSGQMAGRGLNAAWFLYNADKVAPDEDLELQTDSSVAVGGPTPSPGEVNHKGWVLALVENTRYKPTSGGAGAWTNSYAPMLEYELVPRQGDPFDPPTDPEDAYPNIFNCFGRNEFVLRNNYLTIPSHVAIVEPFWP